MIVKHDGKISAPKALSMEREGSEQATKAVWQFDLSDAEVAEYAAAGAKLALSTALTQAYNAVNKAGLVKTWADVVALLPTDRALTTADFVAVKQACGVGSGQSVKDMSLVDIVMAKFGLTRPEAEKVARSMERSIAAK
jgi:hypothetical protein